MPDSLLHTSFMDIIIQPPLNVIRFGTCWFDDSVHHGPTKNNLSSPKIEMKQVNELRGALITWTHQQYISHVKSPGVWIFILLKKYPESLAVQFFCGGESAPHPSNQLYIYQPLTRCHHLQNLWVVPRRKRWWIFIKTSGDWKFR